MKREEVEIPFFNSEVLIKNINNDNLLNVYKTLCRSHTIMGIFLTVMFSKYVLCNVLKSGAFFS